MSESLPAPQPVAWSDEFSPDLSEKAAKTLQSRVVYSGSRGCEIVLEGRCPRCGHPMISTHPARGVSVPGGRDCHDPEDRDTRSRLITIECRCAHAHDRCPPAVKGCGAAFAVCVRWTESDRVAMPASKETAPEAGPAATLLGLEQERALQAIRATELDDVRKSAGNWRTGLGALLTVLVAVLFVKGKQSFEDISSTELKLLLAALLVCSAGFALYGAYRAVRAAYGLPSDEYTGSEDSWTMKLVRAVKRPFPDRLLHTPSDPRDFETVGAWRHALATLAVDDLRQAKIATVVSLVAFAGAAVITWFA